MPDQLFHFSLFSFKSILPSFSFTIFNIKPCLPPFHFSCFIATGRAGFEPTTAGVKVLCLTSWRRPNNFRVQKNNTCWRNEQPENCLCICLKVLLSYSIYVICLLYFVFLCDSEDIKLIYKCGQRDSNTYSFKPESKSGASSNSAIAASSVKNIIGFSNIWNKIVNCIYYLKGGITENHGFRV